MSRQHDFGGRLGLMKFLSILALLTAIAGHAGTLEGRIIGIADGDTVTLLDGSNSQHKIRLAGIDAPEKKQAFGTRSKESLSDIVFGKTVTVETGKIDRYGRTIGKILVNDTDANLEQIKRGMAWHYRTYQREQRPQDRSSYAAAEIDARTAKRGLWQDADPTPPWNFRKDTRTLASRTMP